MKETIKGMDLAFIKKLSPAAAVIKISKLQRSIELQKEETYRQIKQLNGKHLSLCQEHRHLNDQKNIFLDKL